MARRTTKKSQASQRDALMLHVADDIQLPPEAETRPIDTTQLCGKTLTELDEIARHENGMLNSLSRIGQRMIRTRLIPILQEMKKRFDAGESFTNSKGKTFKGNKGNGAYLESLGIRAGTARNWQYLIRKHETAALVGRKLPVPQKRKPARPVVRETEAQLLPEADVQLAYELAEDGTLEPTGHIRKLQRLAKEIREAATSGEYSQLETDVVPSAGKLGTNTLTYDEWISRKLPEPEYSLPTFASASTKFKAQFHSACQGEIQNILESLGDLAMVPSTAVDLAKLESVIRSAGAELTLLADIIENAVLATVAGTSVATPSNKKKPVTEKDQGTNDLDKEAS